MSVNKIDARHRIKRSIIPGSTPTPAPSDDFTDGTWLITDIRPGEFFWNMADEKLWIGNSSGFSQVNIFPSGSTAYDFCSTGIKTSSVSGCSPINFYDGSTRVAKIASSGLTMVSKKPITSENGGGQIDLDYFGKPSSLAISNDGGNLANAFIFFNGTNASFSSVSGSTNIGGGLNASIGATSPDSLSGIGLSLTSDVENAVLSFFNSTNTITLDKGGIGFGTGVTRTYREIEIGDWNMDSIANVNIPHGLSSTEWKTVRGIEVLIRDDADSQYTPLIQGDNSAAFVDGGYNVNSSFFTLYRTAVSFYDSKDFDSTSFNRGFITFWYTPD